VLLRLRTMHPQRRTPAVRSAPLLPTSKPLTTTAVLLNDGCACARVLGWIRVVLEVQLGDIITAHLGPSILGHMVHCSGWRVEGVGEWGVLRCKKELWIGACGRAEDTRHSAEAAVHPPHSPPSPGHPADNAPLTVPPLAQSLKVAW